MIIKSDHLKEEYKTNVLLFLERDLNFIGRLRNLVENHLHVTE